MWDYSRTQFISNIDLTSYFAYLHLYKVNMFGDPSIIVGGAFTNNMSGIQYNIYGVSAMKGYSRNRITSDVTIPVGNTLFADSSLSILFESGRKISALDSNPDRGFIVKGFGLMPVSLIAYSNSEQAKYQIHGIRVIHSLKLRNGGEIKMY